MNRDDIWRDKWRRALSRTRPGRPGRWTSSPPRRSRIYCPGLHSGLPAISFCKWVIPSQIFPSRTASSSVFLNFGEQTGNKLKTSFTNFKLSWSFFLKDIFRKRYSFVLYFICHTFLYILWGLCKTIRIEFFFLNGVWKKNVQKIGFILFLSSNYACATHTNT